jgi:hypothetical protein
MWRSNFTIPRSFAAYISEIRLHLPPTFAAYILLPMFAAYICHLHLPHTFAAYILLPMFAAYICRLHFEQAPIFYACANILGKRQHFNDFFQ